jgi:hypothetical protein
MSVENMMHPPKKCTCDCCCNNEPKTYGPLPKTENNHELLKRLSVMIAEVMETGEKQTLDLVAAPQQAIPSGWKLVPIEPDKATTENLVKKEAK